MPDTISTLKHHLSTINLKMNSKKSWTTKALTGLRKSDSRSVPIGGKLVPSFVDNKIIICVSAHHRPKEYKDALTLSSTLKLKTNEPYICIY